MENLYQLLEISEDASAADIKAAFKRLAVRYHPDKHAGNPEMEERFKEINLAYQTLSNPYEKARYDIKLAYGRSSAYQPPTTDTFATNPKPRPYHRPQYKEREIDWKENWIATAYAFGFTIIVATLVMTFIWIKSAYDSRIHAQLLMERRGLFNLAKQEIALGKVNDGLIKLNELSPLLPEEGDMRDYKENLFDNYILQAEESFFDGQYQNAIYYFELIDLYAPKKPLQIKEHLASAYHANNQPYHAIKIYKELLITGYNQLDCYLSIGEIYRDDLNDHTEALRYYKLAHERALKQYKSFYGEAYFLVLSENLVPPRHYQLFTGLAALELEAGELESTIKLTDWNTNIWPRSAENFLIAAQANEQLEKMDKACENYKMAITLGMIIPIPAACRQ